MSKKTALLPGVKKLQEGTLYHYTNTNALLNILLSKKLWISKIDFLNDYSEINLSQNLMKNVFEKLDILKIIRDICNIPELKSRLDKIENDLIESCIRHFEIAAKTFELYALSLSEEQDSMTLWSNYSKNDGYNIAFNIKNLISNFRNAKVALAHGRIIYDLETQEKILRKETSKIKEHFFEIVEDLHNNKLDKEAKKSEFIKIIWNILIYSTFFKSNSFKDEKEYRFVFMFVGNEKIEAYLKYRVSNNAIFPYLEFPLDIKSCMEKITIGPKNNSDLAIMGLEHFLKNNSLSDVEVTKSSITLRY
jgi:hypothetical protein